VHIITTCSFCSSRTARERLHAKYKAKSISSLLLERLIKNFVNMKAYFKLATRLIEYEPVRCLFTVGCPVTQANVHSSIV